MNEKLTPSVQLAYDRLQKAGRMIRSEKCSNGLAEFVAEEIEAKLEKSKEYYSVYEADGIPYYRFSINRQSLNRLASLGYARYADKNKTIVEFVDKDKPCEWCNPDNGKFISVSIHYKEASYSCAQRRFMHCPNCGRKLMEENENG